MAEEVKMSEVMDEIKNATEEELREVIMEWYERTRTDGLRIGAKYIATGVLGAIQKNLNKVKPSLRDYERCIKDIKKIVVVQLAQQYDSEEQNDAVEEIVDEGTAETVD